MASQGTPNEGLDERNERVYAGTDFILVAYTNLADSFDANSVLADLNQPTSTNGYAPITLDGTWSSSNGVATYLHSTPLIPENPALTGWSATGTWSATVNGVAIVTATRLVHFKDLGSPFTAADGRKLGVDLDTVLA